jgi:hypothetical protein
MGLKARQWEPKTLSLEVLFAMIWDSGKWSSNSEKCESGNYLCREVGVGADC